MKQLKSFLKLATMRSRLEADHDPEAGGPDPTQRSDMAKKAARTKSSRRNTRRKEKNERAATVIRRLTAAALVRLPVAWALEAHRRRQSKTQHGRL